ncbi:tetratricopeptide repeat protein [Parabacteroides bouchesdurhonensis]|uniref:tetratricopeptide repeat protein n=1 Tax=Parabacteroides bouchesdurhonensis TaxID=1936995 RepID=UPI000E54F80F|nr:tetratricopeptide repeat protein [Parabacteroides bouchesdurhonensis]RHJ95362.1 tetratricopeptide repeat protein [Bacteroides sp. AM07-16]
MKKQPIVLLLCLLMVYTAGCHHNTPRNAALQEAAGTETTLTDAARVATRLYEMKQYDSAIVYGRNVLQSLPQQLTGNRDTLKEALSGLCLAVLRSGNDGRKPETLTAFFDSLRTSSHPFLSRYMQPMLTAVSALNHSTANDGEGALKLADSFAAAPRPADRTQELFAADAMARVYNYWGNSPQAAIGMQERAVQALRDGGRTNDAPYILSFLGYYYRRNGEYEKAAQLFIEAIKQGRRNTGKPTKGMVYAYANLAALYSSLCLHDKSLEATGEALQCSLAADSFLLSDLYRFRSLAFSELHLWDSAFVYNRKAEEVALATGDRTRAYICRRTAVELQLDASPDSVSPGLLRETAALYADSAAARRVDKVPVRFLYGQVMAASGSLREGMVLMEQALNELKGMDWQEQYAAYARILLDYYAREGKLKEMARLYPSYMAASDSLNREEKLNFAIGANVRYETGRKEQENRALSAEVALKGRTLTLAWTSTAFLAILLLAGGMYFRQRQRLQRRISEARLSRITSLLDTQGELDRRNRLLAQTLDERERELQEVTHRREIGELDVKLNRHLSGPDEVANFRQSFKSLYPDYLPALRQHCPDLTRTDELIAMLLLLGQNNDEIALTLGISRAGINKARSRMRKRLGLVETGVVLEDFLKNIGGGGGRRQ